VKDVFSAADSLDVEYRADIELSAIEQGKVPDAKLAEQALEHLYEAADGAEYYSQLRSASPTHFFFEDMIAASLEQDSYLDRLSIKIRAVSAMAPINKAKAQRELQEIRPQFTRASCKQPLIPDPIDYYAEAGRLAIRLFSPQPKGREQLARWLDEQATGVNSAVQLAPIASLLTETPLGPTEYSQALSDFLAAFAQTPATDREMMAMDDFHHIRKVMHELVAREMRDGVSPTPTVLAYRSFLSDSAKQTPCADFTADWQELVDDFNVLRTESGVVDAVSALVLADMDRATSSGETAVLQVPPDESRFLNTGRKLTDLYQATHGASDWKGEDTTGWEAELSELLNQIDAFDPSKEQCVDCAYWQKLIWLAGTFQQTPEGPYKEKVLEDLVRNLATSPLQTTKRTVWLGQMKFLLDLTRAPSKEQSSELERMQSENRESALPGLSVSPAFGEKVRAEMRRSGNNTMYVYVEADELFHFPYWSPYLSCKVDCH
jgi:hypothetical protein